MRYQPCLALAALVLALGGIPGAPAYADTVDTTFAALVRKGSTISVKDNYILASKWLAGGVAVYTIISLVLIVFLTTSWYRHYNLPMRLVYAIGLTALGTPSALNILLPQFGIVGYDASLNYASALVGVAAISGIVALHWKNTDVSRTAPASALSPGSVSEAESAQIPHESLPQLLAEKLVEGGMPPADAVVKFLISKKIEKIPGEDAYDGLPEGLRSSVYHIIVNNHDSGVVVQTICDAARDATPEGKPLRKPLALRLVSLCRNSAHSRLGAFINQVEFFKTELESYRDRATPDEQPPAG